MEYNGRAVRNVGENMQQVSGNVGRLRDSVRDVGNHTTSAMGSLEAGVKAGFGVLKSLFQGGARPNTLPHFDGQRR
jgi:phage-related protein